jgi:hypothetical protein
MTLREASVVMSGQQKKADSDYNLAYYQAFMSGLFSQQYSKGKFPKYGTHSPWKKHSKKLKRQSWQEQQAIVKAMNAAFGGEFRKRDE